MHKHLHRVGIKERTEKARVDRGSSAEALAAGQLKVLRTNCADDGQVRCYASKGSDPEMVNNKYLAY